MYIILYCLVFCISYANNFNYRHIPIQEEGRIKPLDSFARNQLLKFNGKTSLTIYQNNQTLKVDAIDWLIPILIQDSNTLNIPLFKIENPYVKLNWENSEFKWIEPIQLINYKTVPDLDKILSNLL